MSNVGFSNLSTLKGALLASAQAATTDYDAKLTRLGLGVAAAFERHCDRKFQRTVGATYAAPADRAFLVLDRYPVESISAIDSRDAGSDTWDSEDTGDVDQLIENAGLVIFGSPIGTCRDRIRITFTGGYWWRVAEPTDGGYSTDTLPSGATAIPADLVDAWLLQCEHTWAMRDRLGTATGREQGKDAALATLELIPVVVDMLRPHIRHDLL